MAHRKSPMFMECIYWISDIEKQNTKSQHIDPPPLNPTQIID